MPSPDAAYDKFVRSQVQLEDQTVQGMINSGMYNAEFFPSRERDGIYSSGVFNKCNTFVDDIAKRNNISLPRIKDSPPDSYAKSKYQKQNIGGHGDNIALTADLEDFFQVAAASAGTGITRVQPDTAKSLTDRGEFVAAIGDGHSTVMAPNIGSRWPVVYRQSQSMRDPVEKRKLKVGPGGLAMYHVEKGFDYSKIKDKFPKSWMSGSWPLTGEERRILDEGYGQMSNEDEFDRGDYSDMMGFQD